MSFPGGPYISLKKVFLPRVPFSVCINFSLFTCTILHCNCSSRIKGCPQANYTWIQISRVRRSLEQIKQFEVNFRTKSINSYKLSIKRETQQDNQM